MNDTDVRYDVKFSFRSIHFPPFKDILVLGAQAQHGSLGMQRVLQLLAPDTYDMIVTEDEQVAAVFIDRSLLVKVERDKIVQALRRRVFPYISSRDTVRVDCHVDVTLNVIELES